jgi:hypothetical protein
MAADSESQVHDKMGADAVERALPRSGCCRTALGLDLDGSPIPPKKLELYQKVMALEEGQQRSGVTKLLRI